MPPSLTNATQKRLIDDANAWYRIAVELASRKSCLIVIVRSAGNGFGIDSCWTGMSALVATYPNNLIVVASSFDETLKLAASARTRPLQLSPCSRRRLSS